MAENPYVNKVELADGTTLIDISGDTVVGAAMLSGYTAHHHSGEQITGTIPSRTSGSISINDSAGTVTVTSGYYNSNETKNLNAGTITNNTTLPSGASASGTINMGSYIKIGRGHYKSDTYYMAKDRQLSYDSATKHLTMTY